MDRKDKVLISINKDGLGLEIGSSHNPLAPKKDGYKVHILDHMSKEELIVKYKDHSVELENIEEVDFVWRGESYTDLTGKSKYYDWIIASHIIEHTPDLIGFLKDCDSILKNDGVLSLVVPDKRFCFDYYRPITGISKIIDCHLQKNRIHTAGSVAEYFLNVVALNGSISWNSSSTGKYSFIHSIQDARQGISSVSNDNEYLDVHAWCFVPHSFRLIIHDLYCLGFIPFQEVNFFSTEGSEFFVTLGRKGHGIINSRLEFLEIIEAEIKNNLCCSKSSPKSKK